MMPTKYKISEGISLGVWVQRQIRSTDELNHHLLEEVLTKPRSFYKYEIL
jgi:hypothetical protein